MHDESTLQKGIPTMMTNILKTTLEGGNGRWAEAAATIMTRLSVGLLDRLAMNYGENWLRICAIGGTSCDNDGWRRWRQRG
ncbi:MAG: hypothetical protein QME92_01255 [Bacillota bacterium]|nr:hypothetical protein [Bacillota bacterium]